jgi:hypothetical protein
VNYSAPNSHSTGGMQVSSFRTVRAVTFVTVHANIAKLSELRPTSPPPYGAKAPESFAQAVKLKQQSRRNRSNGGFAFSPYRLSQSVVWGCQAGVERKKCPGPTCAAYARADSFSIG